MSASRHQRWRRLLAQWVDLVCRHAGWVTLAFVLITAGAAHYTLTHFQVDTDRDKMLSADLPFRQTQNRHRDLFPQFMDNLVLVVDATTPEDARDAARALAGKLEEQPLLFRHVYLPRTDFLEEHGLLYLSREELEDLAQRLAEVQPFLGRLTGDESLRGLFTLLREAVEAEAKDTTVDLTAVVRRVTEAVRAAQADRPYRLSWQELMSDEPATPDDLRQFVLVQPALDYGRLLPATPALDAVRSAAADLSSDPEAGVRVRVTGGLAMAHEELQTVQRGFHWIGLAALFFVGLILWLGLRSRRMVFASLTTLVVGLVLTAGFAMLAIGHLNLISVAFGILYIGLGIDYAIHFCLRYREDRLAGLDHRKALGQAAQDVGGSLVLCSISTALGFYAFIPTAYAGVSELGLISGTGMFISLFLNLTLLPALLSLMATPKRGPVPAKTYSAWRSRLIEFPVRRHRGVLLVSAVLAVVAVALLTRLTFDSNPLNLRDPNSESVATFDELLSTSENPPWTLDALAEDEQTITRLATALKAKPEVREVVHLGSYVPGGQDAKLSILEDTALSLGLGLLERSEEPAPTPAEVLAAARALQRALADPAYLTRDGGGTDKQAARGLAAALGDLVQSGDAGDPGPLLERLGRSLLTTLPGNIARLRRALNAGGFTEDDLPVTLKERWVGFDGTRRLSAFPREALQDPVALRRFVAAVRDVAPDATGSPVVMLESGRAVADAFRWALLVALVATSLVLFALLRSLHDVVFVLAPLLLASALTCGAMVALGVPLNFANVIALPLLLGVGVDNGIHMVDRARHGLGQGAAGNPLRTSTARAVIFSTLTTALTFGQLALSPHPGTASMGQLLSLGMFFTLLCTLVVIPALLSWDRARRVRAQA